MSASNAFENALLLEMFNQVAIPGLTVNYFLGLHTADPGEAGDQSTSELTYTGYARLPVERIAGNWTVTGNEATNATELLFGECTSGTETVTHFSIGVAIAGASMIVLYGPVDTPVPVSPGVTPRWVPGALVATVD